MGRDEVTAFVTHLAVHGKVSASTQNQALSSILFLYRNVLENDIGWIEGIVRGKERVRIPEGFEVIVGRPESNAGIGREFGGKPGTEFRMRVDCGTDSRTALSQSAQTWKRARDWRVAL